MTKILFNVLVVERNYEVLKPAHYECLTAMGGLQLSSWTVQVENISIITENSAGEYRSRQV